MGLRLEDIELIKQTKYRYQRSIDSCDLDTLREILHVDIETCYSGGDYEFVCQGKADTLAFIAQSFNEHIVTSHMVHEPIVTVADDGSTGEGQFTLHDYFYDMRTNEALNGVAIYRDNFVMQDGRWKLRRISYTRLYEQRYQERPHQLTSHLLARTGTRIPKDG